MPVSAIDSLLFRNLFGTGEIRNIFDDKSYIDSCVLAEKKLAHAQAWHGVVPNDAAETILFVHWGATTQDIQDTATVMQMRDALILVEARLKAIIKTLSFLVGKYRECQWLRIYSTHGSGLVVNTDAMKKNMGRTRGLIVAEAVMMEVAKTMGRQRAHEVVYGACRETIESSDMERTLLVTLSEREEVMDAVARERLEELCQPENYLGAAGAMVDAVLALNDERL